MKNLSIKNLSSTILSLCLIALFSISCSSDDEKEQDTNTEPAVVFTSLESDKTISYIEDAITVNIEGTDYTDINLTSSNTKIKITKVTSSIYEISSTEATTAKIYAEIKNSTSTKNKNIDLTFIEHGVKNSRTVEGITVDVDKSAKVSSILGEPEQKTTSPDGLSEAWNYPAKGLNIIIVKKNSIVNQINILTSNYFITKNEEKISYTNYPYEIGNGWKVNNTTMDMVVTELGTPSRKSTHETSLNNRAYEYATQKFAFRFYSDSEDNFTGKKIIYFSIY